MPIFLNLLRNPYAIGVLAVLLVGGIQQARVWKAQTAEARAVSELAQAENRWATAVAQGEKAAREAVEAAVRRERERAASRVSAEREAAERLREAARAAQREAGEWRERYRRAVTSDPDCAAWSKARIQCPVN